MVRRSKYGNKKVRIDNITFDSIAEGARYHVLKSWQSMKLISGLAVHPRFEIRVNGRMICFYLADFQYYDDRGALIVEDVKGVKTREYIIKRKLMAACHGIEIKEVRA